MPVRAEVQRRAEQLGRSMKAGLPTLWAVIAVVVIIVGGDVAITLAWGVRHLIWGLVILLVVLIGVLAEGSYRAGRHRETEHAAQLAQLRQQHDAKLNELEAARHAPTSPLVSTPITVNQAEWIATCDEAGEFPGKALVFNLRHRFDNMGARLAFGTLRCIVIDPDGISAEATGTQLFYQYREPFFENAPPVRPGLYQFRWQGQKSSGEWVDITSGEHEVKPPLIAEIVDSKFENWKYLALIVALRVKLTNTTKAMMGLSGIAFTHDPDGLPGLHYALSREESLELERELQSRRERQYYGIPLRNHATVPPGESITGWIVEAVPRRAEGGAPCCTVVITDVLRNEYRATLPKREPQTYG